VDENVYIQKIVSGGQTGADRAALDYAIAIGIPHGGWCPKGRKAEDGPIDRRYALAETPRADCLQRTEWNVRDTDGTVIFTVGAKAPGRGDQLGLGQGRRAQRQAGISGLAITQPGRSAINRFFLLGLAIPIMLGMIVRVDRLLVNHEQTKVPQLRD
jgi:hypothetical protein